MKRIPTVTEIRDDFLSELESETGRSAPLLPRSTWRVLGLAVAVVVHLAYRYSRWTRDQIFTATADEEALIERGRQLGVTRTPAQTWEGTVTATGDDDSTIPAGTRATNDGNVYEMQSTATISGGTATVQLEALEAGDEAHLESGDTVELQSPIAGVDSEMSWASTTQAGEDAEDIEDYRARIRHKERNQPQGGAVADYVQWTIEVPGISEAFAFQPTKGFVNVYPLTDDADPANRIPNSSKLTEVEDYVGSTRRRPLNATVSAVAFTELEFDVDIANLSPSDAETKDAIEKAIEDYLYARRPKQYSDEPDPKNVVSAGEITKIAVDAGAKIATVTLKNAGGSTITDYTLQDFELSVLRTLTWV